ncbi:Ger(x)C family spore germination protein [Gorillibacterium sp. sgz5001074]|uniref:Ger(x)C family spore germination protein n=1 Tax=Gorillibacterium sp. sgz5001074 TaxID=3446695 RepID=UPI003F66486A
MRPIKIRRLVWLPVLLLLAGCWDRSELNELSITSATAIDKEKDNWKVSYQVIIPGSISGSGGLGGGGATSGQAPIIVHSVTSKTIREAAALSHLETPRKLYIGHNSTLVISEKAAREGVSPILDIYLRNHEARETVSVVVTSGEARSILEQLMSIERIPGQGIQRLLEQEQKNLSYVANVRLYQLTMDLLGEPKTGVLPEIMISGSGDLTKQDKLKGTSQPAKLKLGRLAVIRENKMIGWLSREEALGTAFLKNKVEGTQMPFSCTGDDKKLDATYLLTGSKTEIKPKLNPDTKSFDIQVEIKSKGRLNEADCALDLLDPGVIRKMEESIAKEIERSSMSAWEAVNRMDADVIGLSSIIQRKNPKEWKRMKQEKKTDWKSMKLTVKAQVTLERIGLSNKAFRKMMED